MCPTAQSSARALASAADVAIERAARSDLQPTVIGVLCERAGVCPRRNRRRARSPRLPTSRSSEQHVLTCSRR